MKIFKCDYDTNYDEMILYILSDVHIEDFLHNKARFNQYINEINANPAAKVIFNGDIINNAIVGGKSDIYGDTMTPDDALDLAYDLLNPIKDKIILLSEGNHEIRTYKSTSIRLTKQLAIRLYGDDKTPIDENKADSIKIPAYQKHYSPGAYLIFLSFGRNKDRLDRKTVYTIYGRHGSGGGKTMGGKLNRVAEMENTVDADIYIHSHTHLPATWRSDFIRCDYRNRKTTQITHTFVNTNAFLNFGGYGEELGFKPSTIKVPKIVLKGYERDVEVRL